MARRYYVCKIIGDGTETNPYRPKVADYPVSWVVVLGSNPDGSPKKAWALVLVNTVNHDPLLADNQIFGMPDATLDSTWGALNTPTRNQVTSALQAEGIDTSWIKNATLIREIIRYIGREQEPDFSENNFDVAG